MKTTRNREAKRKPDEAELSSVWRSGFTIQGIGAVVSYSTIDNTVFCPTKRNYENNRQQERQRTTDTNK